MVDETPTVAKEEEAEDLRPENEDLLTKLKYLQAEFENYRKRAARDAESVVRFAHEALLSRLLPILDELDAAVGSLAGDAGNGIRMVRDNLMKGLREAGLEEIPAQGARFDPYTMDAVDQVIDPNLKDGVVKEVVRKGYRLHDRILRPAHVVVVRNRGEPNG